MTPFFVVGRHGHIATIWADKAISRSQNGYGINTVVVEFWAGGRPVSSCWLDSGTIHIENAAGNVLVPEWNAEGIPSHYWHESVYGSIRKTGLVN